jgi:hypothetical protein
MKITVHIEDATIDDLSKLLNGFDVNIKPPHKRLNTISNCSSPMWTQEERDTISKCADGYEAIELHRKRYPESKRTNAAIRRQWLNVHEQTPIISKDVPVIVVKPSEEKPPLEKKTRSNKYGIPSDLYIADKKMYDRLNARCKAHGINYEEALKREKPVVERKPITSPTVAQPQQPTPDIPLRSGGSVKHIGSKASPFFGQTGTIQKMSADGQLFVKFGESFTWISPYSVTPIPESP